MTIVESLTEWLKGCPQLEGGVLNIDWLPDDAKDFSVDVVPCAEVIQRYTTGATKRQFIFYLASHVFLGDDVRDAQDNYEFYEEFAAWLEAQNRAYTLPDLGENRAAKSIKINTSGYPMQVSEDGKARYQIQLTLIYAQED